MFAEHSSMLGYVPGAGKQLTAQWEVDGKCLGVDILFYFFQIFF